MPSKHRHLKTGLTIGLGLLLFVFLPGSGLAENTKPSVPVYSYRIVNTYPHDPQAFTQGLVFENGVLYESTGLYGKSSLRKVELKTGRVLKQHLLPSRFFGEGITVFGERIVQVTWKSGTGIVYDTESFGFLKTFTYPGEGWGITHDGTRLIMSDGTETIRFLDPESYKELSRMPVRDGNGPVKGLNELEFAEGEIFANVWPTERIARIHPATGSVVGWIDLKGLLSVEDRLRRAEMANGIAYDSRERRLFVTGKRWSKLFEIKLTRR